MKYVYMFRVGKDSYKIGIASDITKRVKTIQTSNAQPIEVVTAKLSTRPNEVEKELHRRLATMRADGGTEWFHLNPEQAIDIAVAINNNADVEPAGQISVEVMVQSQRAWQKSIDRKLDLVLYGKPKKEIQKVKPDKHYDDLELAQTIVVANNKASTSLLQRHMKIGYGKAARIIESLEAQGIIGPANGAKPRTVNLLK